MTTNTFPCLSRLAVVMALASGAVSAQIPGDTAVIRTRPDVLRNQGGLVTVEGRYTQVNLAKRPGAPPGYGGYVALELADSSYVLLESGDSAVRPRAEILRFLSMRVRVAGTLYDRCNLWGDGTEQTIIGPCLKNPGRVTALSPDSLQRVRDSVWRELEARWRVGEFRRWLAANKIRMNCATCTRVQLQAEFSVDSTGTLGHYRKLDESLCGRKFTPRQEKSFMRYFLELRFPPELRGTTFVVRLGAGLSC